MHKRQIRWGWIFLSPWIIGFLVFTLFPMLASLVFTFTDFNLNDPDAMRFIGFDNYVTLTEDPDLHTALRVTVFFMLISLPFSIIIPLCLALLLNAESLWGKRLFRTLFYMPFVVPAVSAVGIWNGFLNSQSGWLNRFLELIGIAGPAWTDSTTYIYPALLMIGVWATGNAMLVTLAGLQGVPTELYEAAKVDGAGPVRRVWVITLPMISPVIFYNLILTTIGLFRYFDVPYMLKRGTGDPGNSTLFYNIHFYKTAFTFKDMGYGATQAWGLFVVALLVTLALFYSARFWVYYAGGD
jgi:multiple sugar transport system permease protein